MYTDGATLVITNYRDLCDFYAYVSLPGNRHLYQSLCRRLADMIDSSVHNGGTLRLYPVRFRTRQTASSWCMFLLASR